MVTFHGGNEIWDLLLLYKQAYKISKELWQPDSLHPFEGMMVRSTLFNNDVEPSQRATYKTMEKGELFNTMQYMHSFAMNSDVKI